eukprot:6217073-Pyramimonas_sp.AAC.1
MRNGRGRTRETTDTCLVDHRSQSRMIRRVLEGPRGERTRSQSRMIRTTARGEGGGGERRGGGRGGRRRRRNRRRRMRRMEKRGRIGLGGERA